MILIEATVKPFKLDDIKDALEELGVGGMTVTEVLQTSPPRQRGRSFGASVTGTELVPKIRIEIAAPRALVERIIEAICLHGSAGRTEDGRIAAHPVDAAVRIRTGELDAEALS